MNISRTKFVIVFLVFAFAFLFTTTGLLEQSAETFLGSDSHIAWKSVVGTMLSPIKVVLIGPLLPFIKFLHQDPDTPPPFFLAGFAIYWATLAWLVHFVIDRLTHVR